MSFQWKAINTVLFLLIGTSGSLAAPSRGLDSVTPDWTKSNGIPTGNSSYLANRGPTGLENDLREQLFEEKMSQSMRQAYDDINRDFEARARYSLGGQADYQSQVERNRAFGQYYLRSLLSYHVTESVKKAEANSQEVRTFRTVQAQVEKVAKEGVNVEVSEGTKIRTRADFVSQRGHVKLTSPVVDATFDVTVGAPEQRNPAAIQNAQQADPLYREERYRMSVSRGIPVWGLSSAVSYGSTSNTLSASVAKSLAPNLTAVFDSTKPIDQNSTLPDNAQDSVRLLYGVRF